MTQETGHERHGQCGVVVESDFAAESDCHNLPVLAGENLFLESSLAYRNGLVETQDVVCLPEEIEAFCHTGRPVSDMNGVKRRALETSNSDATAEVVTVLCRPSLGSELFGVVTLVACSLFRLC